MPSIYCLTCGKIIGAYFSILEVDPYLEKAKEKHAPFCQGRPSGLEYDKPTPLVDELSYELVNKEKPIKAVPIIASIEKKMVEGWNWIYNSTKWHYFVDGSSLCKNWMLFSVPENMELGNNNSPDNCKVCQKKLLKRQKENDNKN
jgi:hypothetical protein